MGFYLNKLHSLCGFWKILFNFQGNLRKVGFSGMLCCQNLILFIVLFYLFLYCLLILNQEKNGLIQELINYICVYDVYGRNVVWSKFLIPVSRRCKTSYYKTISLNTKVDKIIQKDTNVQLKPRAKQNDTNF